jgi:rhodanese-related sulfurtransferase
VPRVIDTEEAVRLAESGATLLEVLPASAYRREHLPGARNVPMPDLTRDRVADLDPGAPVVVYCYDTECDLSARAAALLEAYGFDDVADYRGSKTEWFGLGHPLAGDVGPELRAEGVLREAATVPTGATVGDLPDVEDGDDPVCVVDGDGVVLGTVRAPAVGLPADTSLLEVLHPAPPSVRPSIPLDELATSMDEDGQVRVLVTTLDGRLLGLVRREDLTPDV